MSKGMDALRRSKASAGEAPNLPPHRGLLSRPLTNVQFNPIAVTERQSLRGTPRGRVGDYGAVTWRSVRRYCLIAAFMVESPSVACLVRLPIMSLPTESM